MLGVKRNFKKELRNLADREIYLAMSFSFKLYLLALSKVQRLEKKTDLDWKFYFLMGKIEK